MDRFSLKNGPVFRPFGMDNLIKTVKVNHNEMLNCFKEEDLSLRLAVHYSIP